MSLILGILGVSLLLIVMLDFLVTIIGANATSPIAIRIGGAAFRALRRIPHDGLRHTVVGPLSMVSVAIWWIIGVIFAWFLIFASLTDPIIDGSTKTPVDLPFIASHVGHLLTAMGGSTTLPASLSVSVLEVIAALNGMIVMTLAISFVMLTTQTVVQGRRLLLFWQIAKDADAIIAKDAAGLVAGLNTAPFALFFSHRNSNLRLPDTIAVVVAERLDDTDYDWDQLAENLPYFDRSEGASIDDALDKWCQRYSSTPKGKSAARSD